MKRKAIGLCMLLSLLLTGPVAAQPLFTEVTREAGITPRFAPRSSAFGDYDNNGWPDLFLAENLAPQVALYNNLGNGAFADWTAAIQSDIPPEAKGGGAIFGDYDNDGDLDLFVPIGAWLSEQRNLLLRNDRGIFVDVGIEAGIRDVQPTDNAIWLDFDRDGFLDLYTGNMGDPAVRNKLYRNQGNGSFADVTGEAGLDIPLNPSNGGSNGGMAAGDFNDDGWPDLYVGVFDAPNRLFLNDGKGGFLDATTAEIADPGEAFGVTVGDIDNDGDLDIFQGAGGGDLGQQRSLMLLNLGQGQFLDVTEGVGVGFSALGNNSVLGVDLQDIDNDGDLDLLTVNPHFLFLNDGNGVFEDRTTQSGIALTGGLVSSFGDYDLDGFLDVVLGEWGGKTWKLYHNNRNSNHYLRVELVGTRSNRCGIGARLVATAGNLKQMREIFGGMGYNQDELVAHFGLGPRTQVDRLEIRWPSGQVEVLTDIPADQKIRVIEGRADYHRVEPTRWQQAPPETLVAGTIPHLNLAIQPALFEPEARITGVTVDLNSLGGNAEVALAAEGDGSYHLRDFPLAITAPNGVQTLHVMIDQTTSLGPYWTRLLRQVTVVPGEDLVIFDEALAPGWQVEGNSRLKKLDLSETGVVYRGNLAGAFAGGTSRSPWSVTFKASTPIDPTGYTALRFAFHPGEASPSNTEKVTVTVSPGIVKSLLDSGWVELKRKEWQVLEIPLGAFRLAGLVKEVGFAGTLAGTFYLDDIRLVAATPPPVTVVEEERTTPLPRAFALSQNFPNPFNGDTVIRFALPESGEVELGVYDIAGQRVVRLVEGVREVGSYTVRWDGRDGRGRELASGVYLYRLRAGAQVETRKLVLVR